MTAIDLSELTVSEIRERFIEQSRRPVSARLLSKLQTDPRQGVRKIYTELKKRSDQEKRERRRLESMLNFERILWKSGVRHIAGVDEVGVGPLAGPVVAAAVIFPPRIQIDGVDDSKRLAPEIREQLDEIIRRQALALAIGMASVDEIDELNIYQAGVLAMRRAVENLPLQPEHLLVDAKEIPGLDIPQNPFAKGDGINFSIAAASIVAKTFRDRLMVQLDRQFPEYGFAAHKGYSTPEHQRRIREHGPCPAHRKSYTYLEELCGKYSSRFYQLKTELLAVCSPAQISRFETRLKGIECELPPVERRKLRLLLARRRQSL